MHTPARKAALLAGVALCAYVAHALYLHMVKRRRVRGLGGAVPYEDREGSRVFHGQRIEVAPFESLFLKYGATLCGSFKLCACITVEGAVPAAAVTHAASVLFARHPMLRCKPVSSNPAGITRDCALALEVDESMELPVSFHELSDVGSLAEAAESVWRAFERVCVRPPCVCLRFDAVVVVFVSVCVCAYPLACVCTNARAALCYPSVSTCGIVCLCPPSPPLPPPTGPLTARVAPVAH